MVEKILKNIDKNGISDICQTAESFLSVLKEGALELLSATVEEVDTALLQAKECSDNEYYRDYPEFCVKYIQDLQDDI